MRHSHSRSTESSAAPASTSTIGLLAVALAVTFSLCIGSLGSWRVGAALVVVVAWFMVPGVLFVRRLYRGAPGAGVTAVLLGPVWGFALSSVVLLALWVAGVRSGWLVFVAPIVASAASAGAGRLAGSLRPAPLGRSDLAAALALFLLVPLVCGRPYSLVGERLPDGKAYRAYFTADFVWAMAVVGEVSKGEIPPKNPYLAGEALHYYWLAHLLSSLEHRVAGRAVPVEQILLTNALVLDMAFVGLLYAFVRHFVKRPGAAATACAFAFLLFSFEGIERLLALWTDGAPFTAVTDLNIDAISRWIYGSLPVDGLQRLLLYQPHHAVAWALGLSALLVTMQAREPTTPSVNALAGALLALALLVSAFLAIMAGVCVGILQALVILRRRAWRAAPLAALAGVAPIGLAVLVARALQYADRAGSLVTVGRLNPMATHNAPIALLLSFGPTLIMAPIGAWLALRREAAHGLGLVIVVAVGVFFYFFVDVRDHQHVYVGWRAGHLLFMAGAALTGIAFEELSTKGWFTRAIGGGVAALLAVAAAPTTAIDLYNTQDVSNRRMAAGFRWTLILTPDELDALAWIRQFTPPTALVQVEPTVRNPGTWAYVPAFAERRMSAGIPISMVPLDKYERGSEGIRAMYRETTSAAVYARARSLQIDYLVVGPPEREAYPEIERLLDDAPQWFLPVFRNPSMSIFAVYQAPEERSDR